MHKQSGGDSPRVDLLDVFNQKYYIFYTEGLCKSVEISSDFMEILLRSPWRKVSLYLYTG